MREPVPSSVSAEAAPVTEAWFAYWEYVAKTGSNPKAEDPASTVGQVASGKAASDLVDQMSGLAAKTEHLVGTMRVTVQSATVTGSTGTVCSSIRDLSWSVDAAGNPTAAQLLRTPVFKGALVVSGPTWRVASMQRVQSC